MRYQSFIRVIFLNNTPRASIVLLSTLSVFEDFYYPPPNVQPVNRFTCKKYFQIWLRLLDIC